MKTIFCNKKYSGILWAMIVASLFVIISLLGMQLFSGTVWFYFSSIIRFLFGFAILDIAAKLYGTSIKNVLSIQKSKRACLAGIGFLIYLLYYIILWFSGIKSIKGLTIGLLIARIILQQIATGFYEELNYRFLILEGYFYGAQSVKNKLLYAFVSFLLFGAVHVIDSWSLFRFLQTGVIGFAFAVMYLKSKNIVIPMVLHFVYDVFANLVDYMEWNNSALSVKMNAMYSLMLVIMFAVSFVMLLTKEKKGREDIALS